MKHIKTLNTQTLKRMVYSQSNQHKQDKICYSGKQPP